MPKGGEGKEAGSEQAVGRKAEWSCVMRGFLLSTKAPGPPIHLQQPGHRIPARRLPEQAHLQVKGAGAA